MIQQILAAIAILTFADSGALSAEISRPETIRIPAGPFIAGSDPAEREHAYRLDEQAYGHSVTRQQHWYEDERPRRVVELGA